MHYIPRILVLQIRKSEHITSIQPQRADEDDHSSTWESSDTDNYGLCLTGWVSRLWLLLSGSTPHARPLAGGL